ncbi:MAG: hypothetical protein VXW32_02885 [Myxococcota bacterium]|nr:hypothetical protein [Myxococcota bacterium]
MPPSLRPQRPWRLRSAVLALLVACSKPAADCMVGYVRGEDGQCHVTRDTAELDDGPIVHLESSLKAHWERGFPDPFTLREHYLSFLEEGDADCPVLMDAAFSPQDCVSDSGTHFYGLAFYQERDRINEQPGYLFAMQASFELRRPGEGSFAAGGGFGYEVLAPANEPTDWMAFVQGSFEYAHASGWLGEGVTSGLAIRGSHDGPHYRMNIEGGSGQQETYIFWDSVDVDSRVCEGHPVGRIGSRGPGPAWTWWTLDDRCNGCGDVEHEGESLGEFCMDLRGELESIAEQMEVL